MKLSDISNIRLNSQQILNTQHSDVKEVVEWMGAIQAQDHAMAKWAIGVRLSKATDTQIESAINKGEILRTHLLRPTWHFVSADDIDWIIDLTSPQIKSLIKTRNLQLELTETVIAKSNKIIGKLLEDGRHSTRDELIVELNKAKIQTDNNRASHLFMCAELDKIICSGSTKGSKQTFALFEKRVKKRNTLKRDEALTKLAGKYFQSHSPATLQDFIWWSGLHAKDARIALENNKSALVSATIDSQTYWLNPKFSSLKSNNNSVHLLPAFDEILISYRNREAIISSEIHKKAVSSNGIFRPIVVVDSQVTGLWNRTIKKEKVIIETNLFWPHTKSELKHIEKACELYGDFLGRAIEYRNQ